MRSGLGRWLILRRQGYKLRFYNSALSRAIYLNQSVGLDDENVLEALLKSGDVYVDVGANIGSLGLKAWSIVGSTGSVICFEPHPRIYGYLRGNVELNGASNVTCHNFALSDHNGVASLDVPAGGRSDDMSNVGASQSVTGLSVRVSRLDDVLQDLSSIGLLKIDTEGHELFVLRGAEDILSRVQHVFFESDLVSLARSRVSRDDVLTFLRGQGFLHLYLHYQDRGFVPVAPFLHIPFLNIIASRHTL